MKLQIQSFLLLVACLSVSSTGFAQSLSDDALTQIRFDQKLNAHVSPDLVFHDEQGRAVRLGQYFGRKPMVLVLGYYKCPMLCSLVLNGMVESMQDVKWSIGREFEVINVSIDPHETFTLAAAKKRTYLRSYGRPDAADGWHFLTGDDAAIHQLAAEVGFRYAYDSVAKQYAHPSGLIILTPEGKVSQYIFGVTYQPKYLASSLKVAAGSHVGSPVQQLFLLCFHYNPVTGKYSLTILGILRLMAVATVLGLGLLFFALVRRGRDPQVAEINASSALQTPPRR